MGTNYYVRPKGACPVQCDRWVHLGKSSVGWAFTFRAYPEGCPRPDAVTWPVTDFESWARLLELGGIYDERGDAIGDYDFLHFIAGKRGGRNECSGAGDYLDADGNRFIPGEFC